MNERTTGNDGIFEYCAKTVGNRPDAGMKKWGVPFAYFLSQRKPIKFAGVALKATGLYGRAVDIGSVDMTDNN
jgi:hypothetical protein